MFVVRAGLSVGLMVDALAKSVVVMTSMQWRVARGLLALAVQQVLVGRVLGAMLL